MTQGSNFELARMHFLNGVAAFEQNNLHAAESEFHSSLELLPDRTSTLTNLSAVQLGLKKYDEAFNNASLAIRLDEANWEAWLNAGMATLRRHMPSEAIDKFNVALTINPNSAEAWSGKAMALSELGKHQDALNCLDKALLNQPASADFWSNKGGILNEMGEYAKAADCLEQALKLRSSSHEAWHNLGIAQYRQKDYRDAIHSFEKAITLNPRGHDALFNKGLVELTLGNLDSGWPLYDQRWQSKYAETYRYPPELELKTLDQVRGKRILIWHEQGFGDTIQFSRYIPTLLAQGAEVIFEVQESLHRLFDGVFNCQLVCSHQEAKEFDYHIPLLSLPRLFKTNLGTIPRSTSFNINDSCQGANLKIPDQGLKVGLAISGNPSHKNDHNRSLSLKYFQSLANKAQLYLIQKEISSEDSEILSRNPGIQFVGDELQDFLDTAVWVNQMDLIITVDTSLAHLAGSLNKKTLLLLPWEAEWRWLHDRTDSPWYPSFTLCRQEEPGKWDSVIKAIEHTIENQK